jgi:serine acetyltransferase
MHGATLGGSGRQWFDESFEDGFPTVGDYTWVMSGAKVLGPIAVGRRCFVAANAVLTRDLADGEAYTPTNEIADLRRRVDELERLVVEQRSPENHH